MANKVEFIAGESVTIVANRAQSSVTIDTVAPIPTTTAPLPVNRGGTGIGTLTDAQMAGLAASNASGSNKLISESDLDAAIATINARIDGYHP